MDRDTMDRDTTIETYLRAHPGSRLLCGRTPDRSAWVARVTWHGTVAAASSATSMGAALDDLAAVLSGRVAA